MEHVTRGIPEILHDIVANVQDIVRTEIRLAVCEVKTEASKAGKASRSIAVGAVTAFYAAGFILLAVVYALSMVIAAWIAAAIVGIGVAVFAFSMWQAGFKRLKQFDPTPPRTTQTVKENIQWATHRNG